MTTRTRYSGSSTEVPWADAGPTEGFGNQYHRLLGVLFDHSALVLTAIGGTGDAVTASLDPELDGGGLQDGMKFGVTWAAANTGGVTLAINGGSALPVLDPQGAALESGRLASGLRSLIEYVGGEFRILTPLAGDLTETRYYWAFTSSGTWTKPAGLADDAMIIVEAWGAGGSGARNSSTDRGGGGGGGYARRIFRAADLPASVAVAIGAGGAARTTNGIGSAGGNTTFGALLTGYGGGGGTVTGGGGGGGEVGAGATGGAAGGAVGGGASAEDAATIYGGGGGAFTAGAAHSPAGAAAYGGGGGGSNAGGGASAYGGPGGAQGITGSAPGGGGGASQTGTTGAGARGEVRIWIP